MEAKCALTYEKCALTYEKYAITYEKYALTYEKYDLTYEKLTYGSVCIRIRHVKCMCAQVKTRCGHTKRGMVSF